MHLIVGLGNPGRQYAGSRHNLGFRVVETLSCRLNCGRPKQGGQYMSVTARCGSKDLMLVQPLTYMNRSGRAVAELLRTNDVNLAEMLVVYDDLDLPPGTIRLRGRGTSAGHRGIQSIIDQIGTADFPRLRIGIGRPLPGLDGAEYVLQAVEASDCELFEQAVERAAEAALAFVRDGLEKAMNNYNRE